VIIQIIATGCQIEIVGATMKSEFFLPRMTQSMRRMTSEKHFGRRLTQKDQIKADSKGGEDLERGIGILNNDFPVLHSPFF
jgi:hypothetical protein